MFSRYNRLRLRRVFRRQQQNAESISYQMGQQLEKHVIRRWAKWDQIKRFVGGWMVLCALLAAGVFVQTRDLRQYYVAPKPVSGGTFREGLVGEITNMNPIFATGSADQAAAKLMFSSLFSYDDKNNLVGDLAESWSVSDDGTIYTINLRPGIKWHDGQPLTAHDVVFTYNAIKHPDTRSYLNSGWRSVTIQAKNDQIVAFSLPNRYAPFLNSLAVGGILPKHILEGVDPAQLRGHPFNVRSPVGSGPFAFADITYDNDPGPRLRLQSNSSFYRGKPKLDTFILQTYTERDRLLSDLLDGSISAAAGLQTEDWTKGANSSEVAWHDITLNNIVFVFLKMTDEGPLNDVLVRQALVKASDQSKIIELLESRFSVANSPLLRSQFAYNEKLTQPKVNIAEAATILDEAGWIIGEGGIRHKDGAPLKIELITQNGDDYPAVAGELKRQWLELGIVLDVLVVEPDVIQQNAITAHQYQSLLYGVEIGSDPDVFVYWHTSQTGPSGLNLSEYSSSVVDVALESGRTRSDLQVRKAKYDTFLNEWVKDYPAIALYQPALGYAQRSTVGGLKYSKINTPTDRFYNVEKWHLNIK